MKNNVKIYNACKYVLLCLWLVAMLLWLFAGKFVKNKDNLAGYGGTYNDGWTMIKEDGSKKEITVPAKKKTTGDNVVFEKTLPDHIESDANIAFMLRAKFEVIIDGEKRFEYDCYEGKLATGILKSRLFLVPLSEADANKTVQLKLISRPGDPGYLKSCYYGNSNGILKHITSVNSWRMYTAIVLFVFSITLSICGLIIYKRYKSGYSISFLGIGIASTAAWIICDNDMYQILFGSIGVDAVCSYIFGSLIPFAFVMYVNIEQKKRYQTADTVLMVLSVVNSVTMAILNFAGIANYRQTMLPMNAVVAGVIFVLVVTVIIDIVKGYAKQYKKVALGLFMLAFLGIFELVFINFSKINKLDGALTIIGLFFLACSAILNMVDQIMDVQNKARDAFKANEYKSGFLANVSHEIRTPVNAILGMDEMILNENINDNVREYASNIQGASENLLSIINDILDISKIESGKMTLVEDDYNLVELIHDVSTMIEIRAKDRDLEFFTEVDNDLPSVCFGDEVRVRQIMINILTNAVKYTKEGNVIFKVYGKNEDKFSLCFDVSDTGVGIKEDELDSLFDAFTRLDEKANRKIEGTGLGLSIVKQFVNMMGGSISVTSKLGIGSTFHVELPQKVTVEDKIGNFEEKSKQITKDSRHTVQFYAPDKKVLVVDDNEMNLSVFKGLLKYTKMQIKCASSGSEFLKLIRKERYDIIFLDHMMPGMDGIEAFKRMKEDTTHMCVGVPVVMLTANAIVGASEMYLKEGFAAYITKPIRLDQVDKALLSYVGDFTKPEDIVEVVDNGELKEMEEFDYNYALSLLGSKELLKDSIIDFYKMSGKFRTKIEELAVNLSDEKNLDEYRINVHSLKSTSATVGALLLSKLARLSETAAKDGDYKKVEYIHTLLIDEIDKHRARISNAYDVSINSENSLNTISDEELNSVLSELKDALEISDFGACEDFATKLENYSYSEDVNEKITSIIDMIHEMDYDSAIELINDMGK